MLLVERCYTTFDWEDAPEDLALSLAQLSALRAAVAPLCGVTGTEDTGARLLRIVSTSIAGITGQVTGSRDINSSGRGVDSLIRHRAEACALSLLHTFSETWRLSSDHRRFETDEMEASSVLSLLQMAVQAGGEQSSEHNRDSSDTRRRQEGSLFLWRVFQACCAAFSGQSIRSALTVCCISPPATATVSVSVMCDGSLKCLLEGASCSWHRDRDSREATLILMSWCTAMVLSDGSVPDTIAAMRKDSILLALSSLQLKDRKSIGLAVELLSPRLTAKEKTALKHIF